MYWYVLAYAGLGRCLRQLPYALRCAQLVMRLCVLKFLYGIDQEGYVLYRDILTTTQIGLSTLIIHVMM